MPATAKVESLIAGLLRLKGYRALVLLERRDRPIERIFRAAVSDAEFIYLDDTLDTVRMAAAIEAAESILQRSPTLQDLLDFEVDHYRIGRNTLSIMLRRLRVGRLDGRRAAHRKAARETLARSLAVKDFVEEVLAHYRPMMALFNERGYTPAGEVFDGCLLHGVDTIQWCGAPQAGCLIYRRYSLESRGDHPLGLSGSLWRQLLAMPWTMESDAAVPKRIADNYSSGDWYRRLQLQDGKAVMSANEVRRRLKLDPSKKTAIIFCHILYDATFFYGRSLFEDYERWLVETVKAAVSNRELNWIVKVHPVNVWRSKMDGAPLVQLEVQTLRDNFGTLPDHVTVMTADTGVNTFSLFDLADYGVTVRGTIGMELPCFGIPVVTAGTGRYSGRGFTIDPETVDEYRAVLGRLHEIPRLHEDAVRLARLHYHGVIDLKPVPMRSFVLDFEAHVDSGGRFQPDVFLQLPANERLLETEDLGRLVHWLTEEKTPELLADEDIDVSRLPMVAQ